MSDTRADKHIHQQKALVKGFEDMRVVTPMLAFHSAGGGTQQSPQDNCNAHQELRLPNTVDLSTTVFLEDIAFSCPKPACIDRG